MNDGPEGTEKRVSDRTGLDGGAVRRDRREGEAKAVLAPLDHEIGAGDEGDALAFCLGQQRRVGAA